MHSCVYEIDFIGQPPACTARPTLTPYENKLDSQIRVSALTHCLLLHMYSVYVYNVSNLSREKERKGNAAT